MTVQPRRRPRIALIGAGCDILGGHYVQVLALQSALSRDGFGVTVIPINPRPPRALAWVRRVPGLRTAVTQALYWPSLSQLRDVDVVHVFSASYWSFLLSPVPAIIAARQLGKRVVLHYHSGEADDHLRHWGSRVHPWLRRVDQIVVPSRYLEDVFARHGYQTRVIANIVDLQQFVYRPRTDLAPHIVSNRNLEAHYRVDLTLRAFARLQARWPAATLTIAGSGRQEGPLKALAEAMRLRGVTFLGPVSPADMPAVINGADVFVNASAVDNQPVSILEAFAAGVPVVSTAVGDIPAMLGHGVYGTLVEGATPEALGDALGVVLDRPLEALGKARRARQQLDRYTWPAVAPMWTSVYETLAGPSHQEAIA